MRMGSSSQQLILQVVFVSAVTWGQLTNRQILAILFSFHLRSFNNIILSYNSFIATNFRVRHGLRKKKNPPQPLIGLTLRSKCNNSQSIDLTFLHLICLKTTHRYLWFHSRWQRVSFARLALWLLGKQQMLCQCARKNAGKHYVIKTFRTLRHLWTLLPESEHLPGSHTGHIFCSVLIEGSWWQKEHILCSKEYFDIVGLHVC